MDRPTIFLAVAVALAASMPGASSASTPRLGDTTAGGLANECRALVRFENGAKLTARERTGLMFCSGFFSGAFETLIETGQALSCVPGEVDVGQRTRIFLDWTDQNPALLHIHRANAVQLALLESFPGEPSDGPG